MTVWGMITDRAAASRRGALLWVIVIAIERRLPLVPVIEAFASDSRGAWRNHALQLAAALRSGTSLPDALRDIPGIVPDSAVLAAQVGAESGTLGPALRIAAETYTVRQDVSLMTPRGTVIYLLLLVWIMMSLISFLMVYIIPKFLMIFNDFDVELPAATTTLIKFSDVFVSVSILFFPFMMLLFIAAIISTAAGIANFERLAWLGRYYPRIRTPDVLRSLAVVIQAGRPLGSALSSLVAHHPDRSIRKRLAFVQTDTQAGTDTWKSLTNRKLVRPRESAVLASAQRAGNLPWALRNTADNIERKLRHRFLVVVEFVRPVAMLAVGGLVGVIVMSLFMPLITLMNSIITW